MRAALAIATNTFREAIRDRVLYLVLFFAGVVILGSEALAALAVGSPDKVAIDLGLSAVSLFSVLISVMLGLSLVAREIERRTIFTVLSRPVSRTSFILGKLLGLYATVVLLTAAMTVLFAVFIQLRYGAFRSDFLIAIALFLVEDLVVASFALLFASFTTPILGTLFTITVYVVGHLSYGLKMLANLESVAGTAWASVATLAYYVLPNLERFNVKGQVVYGDALPEPVGAAILYGLAYAAALLVLSSQIFSRRDFI